MQPHDNHYVYVWEFAIVAAQRDAFLRAYGPAGDWAALFSRAEGYLGTLLLQDQTRPTRFLTIDRWRSAAAHEAFLTRFRAEYEALDQVCAAFTSHEASLGEYWEQTQPG